MSRTLRPDQFVLPNNGRKPVSGIQVLDEFDFNPNLCKIEVDDESSLLITQDGVSDFSAGPGFWEEVKV